MKASVVLLCLLTISCGGSPSSPSPATMTGNWTITGKSQAFPGATGTGTGSLVQSGSSITGTFNFTGGCASLVPVTGALSGANLTLNLDENGQVGVLTGTVNSSLTAASGTFTTPTGGCTNGDFGTWTATKS